ncbi:uncharacterized protein [Ptychodera flava]|uniref:uncharacterized protein n=1 Tax=Ptychodera flava TaxID=63121 RepID=UPI00396A84F6
MKRTLISAWQSKKMASILFKTSLVVAALALVVFLGLQTTEIRVDLENFIDEVWPRVLEVCSEPGKLLEFHEHKMEVITDVEETVVNGHTANKMTFLHDKTFPVIGLQRIITEMHIITTEQEIIWNTTVNGQYLSKGRYTFLDYVKEGKRGTLVRHTFTAQRPAFLQWYSSAVAYDAHTVLLSNMKEYIEGMKN